MAVSWAITTARGRRTALGTAVLLASLGLAGCNAWHGARLYDRGSDALDRGEYRAAIHDLERASQLVPEASEVHNHLGIAYLEVGRTLDARRAFERSVALDCDNRAAASNLRAVEARVGAAEVRTDGVSR
jgi:Flp pilus assembly protein TadD